MSICCHSGALVLFSYTEELDNEEELLKIFDRIDSVLPNMNVTDSNISTSQGQAGVYGYTLKTRKREASTVLEEYNLLGNATWREIANVLDEDEVAVLKGYQNCAWSKDIVVVGVDISRFVIHVSTS
jgi:hypothetical protein